ncbi:hypothetical protein V6N13_023563 [Hibiscus sabdariffa]|uniref:Uncharacterized protein n=2 Tax=Hibiscus sabdariffa TaxID=183260 RepID=A0ABR2PM81_9ROSI
MGQRVHARQSSSSVLKTKSCSVVASISESIGKCHCCIRRFFSKLDRCFVQVPKREEPNCMEPNVEPKTEPELETSLSVDPRAVVTTKVKDRHLLPPLVPGKKRTIVLDMDGTLVHSKEDPPPPSYDFMITPNANGVPKNFYVLKRPGVDEFLEAISEKYEVVVFTAGMEAYASLLLDVLDPKGLISHRLYRDSCRKLDKKNFAKDLSKIGRELGNVVIVDDIPMMYCLQPENGIPIKKFTDDFEDRELEKLLGFFQSYCDGFDDMRDAVKHYFGGAPMIKPVSSTFLPPQLLD